MLLYKYRSLDSASAAYTLDILEKQKVMFSRPDSFNDPFEFRPKISLEATTGEFTAYLDGLFKRKRPDLNRQQRKQIAAEIARDRSRNHQSAAVAKLLSDGMAEIIQMCGVYCMSTDPANILMWSHYADCHRGICFGFDGASNNPFFGKAQQVHYQKDYPVANLIKDDRKNHEDKIILTKSDFWSYEQEWRIINHEQGSGIYEFQKSDLKQVIFGVRTPEPEIQKVCRLLSSSHVSPQVMKASLHEERYELVLSPFEFK